MGPLQVRTDDGKVWLMLAVTPGEARELAALLELAAGRMDPDGTDLPFTTM